MLSKLKWVNSPLAMAYWSTLHLEPAVAIQEADAKLEVYSTEGRMVHTQIIPANTSQNSIDLQEPAAGLYQVRVVAGGEVIRTKVVVQ